MAPNRLIHEKSPYLRQHSENPVDWYPWGEEAFAKAKELDRPILLSIGYSTCHYCHLMEKETFSQKEIAHFLNEHFISIKVDREELPEVDSLYMEFASALSPHGVGWPLNLLLTPDLKPFVAVSYLPLKRAQGMIGFEDLIQEIAKIWKGEERQALVEQGDKIVELFKNIHHIHAENLPEEEDIAKGFENILTLADPLYGGLKGAPKFPLGEQLLFMLEIAATRNESRALYYVEKTLEMMSRGGIRDVLGGGFARYSVDERWMVPHFEKMIYDNALLLEAYASYYAASHDEKFGLIAQEIGDYLIRRMSEPGRAFFTAEDADSEGEEGRFYTWRYEEIFSLLPIEEATLFCDFYHVKKEGNFKGTSILFQIETYEEFAKSRHLDLAALKKSLENARVRLFEEREKRPKPFRDEKIIAGWNGLVIAALAKASGFLNRPDFMQKAQEVMSYLLEHHFKGEMSARSTFGGEVSSHAVLEDYAFVIRALITLFEMGGEYRWLNHALRLCGVLDQRFLSSDGSYYSTDEKDHVLVRRSEFYDGTLPSGNGMHAENLVRLFQLLKNPDYLTKAEGIFRASKGYIEAFTHGAATLLKAFNRLRNAKASLLVVTLDEKRTFEQEVRGLLFSEYRPHTSLIFLGDELTKSLSGFEDSKIMDGKTTFYFCTQKGCLEPMTSFDKLKEALAVV